VAGIIDIGQSIGKRSLIEHGRKELRRHDDKPGGNYLDCCDNLITAGPAIEDGVRTRAKRANDVLLFRSVEQNKPKLFRGFCRDIRPTALVLGCPPVGHRRDLD